MSKSYRHSVENKDYIEAMRELRKSNAAQPYRNKAKYNRKGKYRPSWEE